MTKVASGSLAVDVENDIWKVENLLKTASF